jgi:hypothetical protein
VRYRREMDTVAGVLLLVATWLAVTAWWTGWRAEEPRMPSASLLNPPSMEEVDAAWRAVQDAQERELAREEALLAAPALALTAVVLLAVRRKAPRPWAGPVTGLLLLTAVAGTAYGALAPVWWTVRQLLSWDLPAESVAILAPFVAAPCVAVGLALALATRLTTRGTADEAAAGGVLAWGVVTLGWLVAAPRYWTATSRSILGDYDLGRLGWSATLAGACLAPAAALVVVTWSAAPPAGRDALVARCRGACVVLAVILLLDAVPALSSVIAVVLVDAEVQDWAMPQAALLVTAAGCASLAAARWRWAPVLVPVAAAAATAAVLAVIAARPPEHVVLPALVVTGVLAPLALTACVLWTGRRSAVALSPA